MNSHDLRKDASDIFQHAISAVNPYTVVKKSFMLSGRGLIIKDGEYNMEDFNRIIVIGAGKAAAPMARAVEDMLSDRITSGLVITKYGHAEQLNRIMVREAGHPLPDEAGLAASEELIDLVSDLDRETLVIMLLSGGGSALLCSPSNGLTLQDKIETTRLLLNAGADIHDLNAVRKHISRVKGGGLAAMAYPACIITLILSDVIGNQLDVIASGPTAPDETTYQDAISVIERYSLCDLIPKSVIGRLEKGAKGGLAETPKNGDVRLGRVRNIIIGDIRQALGAAEARAAALGYRTLVLTSLLTGEARETARLFPAIAREIIDTSRPIGSPACILSGGETTVTVRGDGMGGRNQEMALSAAIRLNGIHSALFLSAGTDGTDGPTDAAGAFADGSTVERARRLGMNPYEYLDTNDSYNLFKRIGDLFITGPTKTNVMDIQILLVN